jgi:hypothetical protein
MNCGGQQVERIRTRDFVKKKMIYKLRVFYLVSVSMFSFIVYEIATGAVDIVTATTAMILGIFTGWLVAQRYRLAWNDEAAQVVTKMDRLGIFLLVIYLAFTLSRKWIFSHWLTGEALTLFTLTFGNGAMMARVVCLRKKIRKIIRRESRPAN